MVIIDNHYYTNLKTETKISVYINLKPNISKFQSPLTITFNRKFISKISL